MTDVQAQSYWRPSDALRRTLRKLYEKDYAQFPCIPCSYCSRLLYPHSVKWVIKDDNFVYPLQSSFPQLNIITNPRNESKIAVCNGCKSNHNNRSCYALSLKYLNVFTMFHMQKESIYLPSIYTPV